MVWSGLRAALLLAAAVTATATATDPAWSYHEDDPESLGPLAWGDGYKTCNGQRQSPVNLPQDRDSADVIDLWGTRRRVPLKFSGNCYDFDLMKLGEVYKWLLRAGSSKCQVEVRNDDDEPSGEFDFQQFHVHATSEHTINGHHYAGEVHFVHKVAGGNDLLVTGLLLNVEAGAPENPWLNTVLDTMSQGVENATVPVTIDDNYVDTLRHLVRRSHLFNYPGSLTTPPCTESVDWWVLNNPLSISPRQYERLLESYKELPETDDGSSNRPTQPLHGRKIKYL